MLDIKKLREKTKEIQARAKAERDENLKFYVQKEVINILKNSEIQNELLNKKSRIDLSQSSRVMNSWEKEGIIDKEELAEGKWRKYSKVEAIWLSIVNELREFGFALDKIRKIKNVLFNAELNFSPLEYAIAQTIMIQNIVIVVYSDGTTYVLPENVYQSMFLQNPLRTHVCINLFPIIYNHFPNNNFNTLQQTQKSGITEKELQLLYYLRTGDYQSIKIIFKDGEISLLEADRKINPSSKIIDIINNKQYQKIEIHTQQKKVVSITTKEKIRL